MRLTKTYHQTILLSIVGYGACIWAHILKNVVPARTIREIQRNILLRLSGAYRTVTTDAMIVTLGVWPLDLLIRRKGVGYWLKKNKLEKVKMLTTREVKNAGKAEVALLSEWQKRLEESKTGRRTFKLFPNVVKRGFINSSESVCGPEGTPGYVVLECFQNQEVRRLFQLGIQVRLLGHILRDPVMWKLLDAITSEVSDKARNDYLTALNEARDRRPRLDRQELQNRTDDRDNDDDGRVSGTETNTSGTYRSGYFGISRGLKYSRKALSRWDSTRTQEKTLSRLIPSLGNKRKGLRQLGLLSKEGKRWLFGSPLVTIGLRVGLKMLVMNIYLTYQTSSSCSLGKDVRKSPYFWPPYPLIGSKDEAIKPPTFWPPNSCVLSKEGIKEREQFLSSSIRGASSLREGLKEAEHFELPQVMSSSRESLREDGSFEISRVTSLLRGELREAAPFETHHARHPPGESKELHDLKTLQVEPTAGTAKNRKTNNSKTDATLSKVSDFCAGGLGFNPCSRHRFI
uniref:Uncharacterized protein n=1 Tax=Timema poppense TaxID=170557 RepID=A0A7R9CS73_TIMPO|nr:unnamed protein product [Timema poppensis]